MFNLSGHGHFDLSSYDRYLNGAIEDYILPEAEIKKAQEALPVI